MNLQAVSEILRGDFKTLVETALSLPTVYDTPSPPISQVPLKASVMIIPGATGVASISVVTWRTAGVMMVMLWGDAAKGSKPVVDLADSIARVFRKRSNGIVRYQPAPQITRVGVAEGLIQYNVSCPWTAFATE